MQKVIHKSNSRGIADHGWLQANHSFSFGSWYHPNKTHFGKLRVLNDDIIKAGYGFGKHPHDNMEIITIPLSGALEHNDNTGGNGIIKKYDVQVMSAGSGIEHSEFNHSKTEEVCVLQLWILTNKKNVEPRYDQKSFLNETKINHITNLVAPFGNKGLWIYQDAWISLGKFEENYETNYKINKFGNGVYIFVISGEIEIEENVMLKRDAIGVWDVEEFKIKSNSDSEILFVEVPMN